MIDEQPPPSDPNNPGCLGYGLFAAATLWICAVVGLAAPLEWGAGEILLASGIDWPLWASPVSVAAQAGLIAAPVGLLAALTRAPHLRAVYIAWLLACGLAVTYGLARALPTGWTQAAQVIQAAVGLLGATGLALATRRAGPGPGAAAGGSTALLGGGAALLAMTPWLATGALGSPLDTVIAIVSGAGLGLCAGLLLERVLLPPLAARLPSPAAGLTVGGVALGAALLIVAAAAGYKGANLLLMAALPPLGPGAVALTWARGGGRGGWRGPAALVGGVAAATLALFDPDELTIILGGSDVPTLAAAAAGWAFVGGLAVSAVLILAMRPLARLPRPAALAAFGAPLVVAGLTYALAGHPGFYGDQLFVILRDQANVSGLATTQGREARLRAVYTTLAAHALASQAGLRADLGRVGIASRSYYLVNAIEVDGGPLVRLWLLTRPEVDRVLESPRLRPLRAPPPPEPGDEGAPGGPTWGISAIGADRVWDELGVTGEGIVIGQSDSGVAWQHPALRAGYRGDEGDHAYNWLDPWYGALEPRDYGMHGTHTLGSAAGSGGIGVAPGATWFACANLARNLGSPARYLDCMQFMLAPFAPGTDPLRDGDPARAAHVVNNSWGCPPIEGCDAGSLGPAVDAMRAAGIFVVASAGNEGAACSSVRDPIAIYDSAFSVGAIDEAGDVTSFSSRGPVEADGSGRSKPDIVAPGADILSAQPGDSYGRADGTSMAGPHVAGVVALMWSANPALIGDIERTEQILRDTAAPYSGAGGLSCSGAEGASNVYGAGVVDAYAAVRAAMGE